MFGIDISDRMLRVVSLKKRRDGVVIESANEISVAPGIINEGEIVKPEQLQPIIKSLINSAKPRKPRSNKVIACLPERKSFIKILNIQSDIDLNNELIKSELKNHIPDDLETMYIDWKLVSENAENKSVLVGAVPIALVDTYQSAINNAGLVPYVLEIESAAIVRSVIREDEINKNKGILLIDIGLDRTSFIIYDRGSIQFTSAVSEISGNLMTSMIMKAMSLSYDKAEKAKKLGGMSKTVGKGEVAKVLDDQIKSLVDKINQVINFYQEHRPDQDKIADIVLTGGGANITDLDTVLTSKLKLNITKGNSLSRIVKDNSNLINDKNQTSFATAIGLALRALEYDKS